MYTKGKALKRRNLWLSIKGESREPQRDLGARLLGLWHCLYYDSNPEFFGSEQEVVGLAKSRANRFMCRGCPKGLKMSE